MFKYLISLVVESPPARAAQERGRAAPWPPQVQGPRTAALGQTEPGEVKDKGDERMKIWKDVDGRMFGYSRTSLGGKVLLERSLLKGS